MREHGDRSWPRYITACLLLHLFIASPGSLSAQPQHIRALFLGNSYTYVNDLPLLTAALAHSAGDSLFFDSNTPGGYTLGWQPIAHATNPVSLEKIRQQPWDFVILQEQSQIPSIPALRDSCMLPGAAVLRDSVAANHPCSRLLFYLTWGRRFGGTQCFVPNYCSPNFSGFNHMQDSLTRAYKLVADSLGGWIAPAGEAWRLVINGSSMVLHDGDNSHPNLKGSYLAACVFYASMFRKPSAGLPFLAGLQPDTALLLQRAADSVVFSWSSLWNLWTDLPEAGFQLAVSADTLHTRNTSLHATRWHWDFGDGQTSAGFEPVHVYTSPGTYTVSLAACDSCRCDTLREQVVVIVAGAGQQPANKKVSVWFDGSEGVIRCFHCPPTGRLRLTDLAGRTVAQAAIGSGLSEVRMPAPGLYLWRISSPSEGIFSGKVVIPHPALP